ncbi:putative sulfate/molybdate transporter [Bosea sp. NPDC055353]
MTASNLPTATNRPGRRSWLAECSGACGDLGTFIPHVIGAMTVAGLAPAGVLFGFGVSLVGAGLFYGLPMAVQPMKAVSAVLLTGQLSAEGTAAAGLVIGIVLVVLGATGLIGRVARLIPQSVTAGLQLGLGITMGWLGIKMVTAEPWIGFPALAALAGLPRIWPRAPATLLVLVTATGTALATGLTKRPDLSGFEWQLPALVLPQSWRSVWEGIELAVLPQMPLTLTNAVIVTAAVCGELYPDRTERTSVRNLALTSGIGNLLLAPLGAMPMCHGAGGVTAQHRFGARSGWAPILFGSILLVLALGFAANAAALFATIPLSAVGALLLMAGTDLALSRRLFDSRPDCWPAIGIAAASTALLNPAIGLAGGLAAEFLRRAIRNSR